MSPHTIRDRGLWTFMMGRDDAYTDFEFSGVWKDAKDAVMRDARSLGANVVVVEP